MSNKRLLVLRIVIPVIIIAVIVTMFVVKRAGETVTTAERLQMKSHHRWS